MYRLTKIFDVTLAYNSTILRHKQRRDLQKRYGSKRSGTIYVVADDPIEAKHVFQGLIREQEHIEISLDMIQAIQTHLVPKAVIGPRP